MTLSIRDSVLILAKYVEYCRKNCAIERITLSALPACQFVYGYVHWNCHSGSAFAFFISISQFFEYILNINVQLAKFLIIY